jgi:hypothetical protein
MLQIGNGGIIAITFLHRVEYFISEVHRLVNDDTRRRDCPITRFVLETYTLGYSTCNLQQLDPQSRKF